MISSEKVRLGIIGIGDRATDLMKTMLATNDIEITALCDIDEECLQNGRQVLLDKGFEKVFETADYTKLLKKSLVDAVIIATSWNSHVEIAVTCMLKGIPCGFEVSGASSINECWELVKAFEQTKTPCMMLENCCYGRYELAVLQMIRAGLFGEVVHCEGGYQHDLSKGTVNLVNIGHQRSFHHMHRNADLYPTHEIGPIAQYLNINKGNRFLTLSSTASKSVALNALAGNTYSDIGQKFILGDFVTTVIKCANGETVLIKYDTSLPRPYSRSNEVHGTKGLWTECNKSVYFDGISKDHTFESIESYLEKYDHPLWKSFIAQGVEGGHDGMDYLLMKAFAYCVKNNQPFPIDIYDAAVWLAVTVLSEQSVSLSGAPVPFPDFTNGKWIMRKAQQATPYSL